VSATWLSPLGDFVGDDEPPDDDADEWIIRNIVPRSEPWLLGGTWKGGKTWTAISLAVHIALGRDWCGFENTLGRPGRVLLIALEDSHRRITKRVWQICRGLGITPNHPTLREHLRITAAPLRLPKDKEVFINEIVTWEPDVVIADSLTRVMEGDQNDIKDASALTAAWSEICRGTNAAAGFLHHTNKGNSDQAQGQSSKRLRGSGDFPATARNVIVMSKLEDGLSRVRVEGNLELSCTDFRLRYVRETLPDGRIAARVERDDEQATAADIGTPQNNASDVSTKRRAIALTVARDKGAVAAAGLAKRLGKSEATANRLLRELRGERLLGDVGALGSPITEAGRQWLGDLEARGVITIPLLGSPPW
jgi:hypothetical protein